MLAYAGRFTPGGTGNRSFTGIGFQPKGLIIFGVSAANGANVNEADLVYMMGFTDGVNQYVHYGFQNDSQNTPTTSANIDATKVIFAVKDGSNIAVATIVSFDADGFTLNFTTNSGTAYYYNYLAIGGDDITVKVGNFSSTAATGDQVITGVGFTPDALLTVGGNYFGYGFANATEEACVSFRFPSTNPTIAKSYQSADKLYYGFNDASAETISATLKTFDADGFTVNKATASVVAAIGYMALKGVASKIGTYTKPSSTQTVTVSGLSFTPVAVALTTDQRIASSAIKSDITVTLGWGASASLPVAAGSSNGMWWAVQNNVAGSSTNRRLQPTGAGSSNTAYLQTIPGLSQLGTEDLSSMGPGQFEVGSFDSTGVGGEEIIYMAMGGIPAPQQSAGGLMMLGVGN